MPLKQEEMQKRSLALISERYNRMNYYISDLHLFHKNVTGEGSNFDNRPFKTLDEMHKN